MSDESSGKWDPESLDKSREVLLNYYVSEQNSQSTRLVGFTVGLFALLSLAMSSGQNTLHATYSNYQGFLVFADVPLFWDYLKVIFLYIGTSVILFAILRAIFRYSYWGQLTTAVIFEAKEGKEGMDELLKDVIERRKNEKQDKPPNELSDLNVASVRYIYGKKIFGLPASWFVSVDPSYCDYPNHSRRGVLFLSGLAMFFAILLLLFLW